MNKKKYIIICLLIVVVFLLTIGYAAFSDQFTITNTVAHYRADVNVRISGVSTNSGDVSNLDFTVNKILNNLSLAAGNTVTYSVTARNLGNVPVAVSGVTFTRGGNTISGLSANIDNTNYEKICNGNVCTINAFKTFNLVITNNSGSAISGEIDINLTFTPVYSVTYNNNVIGEVLSGNTFTYTFTSNAPSSVTVTSGTCGTPSISNSVLSIANVTSDLVLSAGSNVQIINNPDGSVTVITDNADGTTTKKTTYTSGIVITQEISYDANDNPIVTSYTIDTSGSNNGGLVLTSDRLDTGYVAFDGNPFQIHMVYKTTINSNTQKHILSVLSKVSGNNSNNYKYDGMIYYVYKTANVRINVLTTDGLSSGYGGVYVADYRLTTGGTTGVASKVTEYTLDMSYNPTTKTITASMTPGNSTNTIETVVKQSNDFPNSLANASVYIGGDDGTFGTNYTMNSIEIIDFSISGV